MFIARKILLVTLSNIGDCILTLPVLDRLRDNFPGAQITVVAGPRSAQVFLASRGVSKVVVYDKRSAWTEKLELIKSMRRERFDLVVDLRNSIFSWLVPGERKAGGLWPVHPETKHMRDRHLSRLSGLRLKVSRHGPEARSLSPGFEEERWANNIFRSCGIGDRDKVIVLSAGARSSLKRWPAGKFSALARRLIWEFKARIILVGDSDDIEAGRYIKNNNKNGVIDLTGKTTILQAAALFKRAELVVTNDSANLHLASYLDRPVVAIFGPTDEVKYGPWSVNSRVAKKDIACRPCMKAQCRYRDTRCIKQVSVYEVLRLSRQVLNPGRGGCAAGPDGYKRILIVRTDRIGDVVLSTPVIKALRDAYPQSYIAMVVRPYTKAIVEGNPYLDEVIVYDKNNRHKSWLGTWRFSRSLTGKKFDLAVILNPSHRSNLIPFIAGIPRRVGYDRKWGFLLSSSIKDTKFEGIKHEIEYNLDLVRMLGLDPADKRTFIPVPEESRKWAVDVLKRHNLLPSDKLAVIHPGASDDSKKWPAERYAEVGDKLFRKGWKIAVMGGPSDRKICAEVIKLLRCPYIDLVGNNNISQAAGFLKHCALFISSDTGPMHIASSLGVGVVAILGRSLAGLGYKRWGPHNPNSVVVQKDVGCPDCLAHKCVKGFLCLRSVSPDDVVSAVESLFPPVK